MKLKTRKSIAKRFRQSAPKPSRWGKAPKLMRTAAGQDHFNAREPGKVTVNKRRPKSVAPPEAKNIRRLVPYI